MGWPHVSHLVHGAPVDPWGEARKAEQRSQSGRPHEVVAVLEPVQRAQSEPVRDEPDGLRAPVVDGPREATVNSAERLRRILAGEDSRERLDTGPARRRQEPLELRGADDLAVQPQREIAGVERLWRAREPPGVHARAGHHVVGQHSLRHTPPRVRQVRRHPRDGGLTRRATSAAGHAEDARHEGASGVRRTNSRTSPTM